MSTEDAAKFGTKMQRPTSVATKGTSPSQVTKPSGKSLKKRNKDIKAHKPSLDTLDENLVQIDMSTQKIELTTVEGEYIINEIQKTNSVVVDKSGTPIINLSGSIMGETTITESDQKWIVSKKFDYNKPFNEVILNLDETNICYPMKKSTKSSPYGPRGRGWHSGLDLPAKIGEPIMAVMDGVVRLSTFTGGYGNAVVVRHNDGIETVYAHCSRNVVVPGMKVKAGDVIAFCGVTGRVTGSHLHLELRVNGVSFDPEMLLNTTNKTKQTGKIIIRKDSAARKLVANRTNQNNQIVASEKTQFDNPNLYPKNNIKIDENYIASNTASTAHYHKVVSGDTLSRIAQTYHTSIRKLCELNHISTNSTIRVNQKIRTK